MKALLLLLLLSANGVASASAVFMYHRFGEDQYPSTSIRLEQFDAQLDYLQAEGFEIWPLQKLVAAIAEQRPLPQKVVSITIDDAYLSVYREAWPRLKARKYPFTVFVSTDEIDQRLPGYMNWEQLRELHNAGATIANHTATHDFLVQKKAGESRNDWLARIAADIGKAQQRLQAELGSDVNESPRLFAWPYGEYDTDLAELVGKMGYIAFGQHSGAISHYADKRSLPRFPMNEQFGSMDEFRLKANTRAFAIMSVTPSNPLVMSDRAPAMTVTLENVEGINRASLTCYFGNTRIEPRWHDDEPAFTVTADQPLPAGRSRYNCTARADDADAWYWFSQLWIRADDNQ